MEIIQSIQNRIYTIRGSRVMLDFDLAQLYDAPTKALNQAVRRNQARFPDDFMFRLTEEEWQQYSPSTVNNFTEVAAMRSQIVTASQFKRNTAVTPYAFTEQGVAMLSSVLHSGRAIQMNIAIMRAFVEVHRLLLDTSEVFSSYSTFANASANTTHSSEPFTTPWKTSSTTKPHKPNGKTDKESDLKRSTKRKCRSSNKYPLQNSNK